MTAGRSRTLGVTKAEVARAMLVPPGKSAASMRNILEEVRGCLVPIREDRPYGHDGLGETEDQPPQQHAQGGVLMAGWP